MPVIGRLAGGDAGPGFCSAAGLPLLSASLKDAGGFGKGGPSGEGRCFEDLVKALCHCLGITIALFLILCALLLTVDIKQAVGHGKDMTPSSVLSL